MAGFTTVRDLGTEGAGYADVGLKKAIAQGIIPGPRMFVVTKAIVSTGEYGPKGFTTEYADLIPQGAEEADGVDAISRVVRDQMKHGADWIKIYADYGYGPNGETRPGFTQEEMNLIVNVANTAGRQVAAHASTDEGMRRAILAGVKTIEHGDGGTPAVFKLMKEHNVCYVPDGRRRRIAQRTARHQLQDAEGGRTTPAIAAAKAGVVQGSARRRCHDRLRQRCRRLRPWRGRKGTAAHGAPRDEAAGRNLHRRNVDRRDHARHGRPAPGRSRPACLPTSSPSTATRPRTSTRCAA